MAVARQQGVHHCRRHGPHDLITQAQQIEFDTGGYIVWSWRNQVDAYSKKTTGYKLDKLGGPIGRMYFKDVYFERSYHQYRSDRGPGPAPSRGPLCRCALASIVDVDRGGP